MLVRVGGTPLIAEGSSLSVGLCPRCGHTSTTAGRCRLDGAALASVDAIEHAVALAVDQAVEVVVFRDERFALIERGSIAALLNAADGQRAAPAPTGPTVVSRSASVAVGLLGDVMLGRGVAETLCHAAPEALWAAKLRELVGSLDAVVCNLECCISDRGSPTTLIAGKPFFFRARPIAVEALRAISVSAVSLANNHALGFGQDALAETLELLHAAGIATAGAGPGPGAARAAAADVQAAGRRLALVAVTDHRGSTPQRRGAGASRTQPFAKAFHPGWRISSPQRGGAAISSSPSRTGGRT